MEVTCYIIIGVLQLHFPQYLGKRALQKDLFMKNKTLKTSLVVTDGNVLTLSHHLRPLRNIAAQNCSGQGTCLHLDNIGSLVSVQLKARSDLHKKHAFTQ